MSNFYQDFIRELLERTRTEGEKESVTEHQVQRLAEQLEKRVSVFILRQLSKDQLDTYAKLVFENGSPEKIHTFLKEHISDFEKKREQLFLDFTQEFIERTQSIRKALDSKE